MAEKNVGTCPVCGEEVDMDDVEAMKEHMNRQDEGHKKHLQRAEVKMFVSQACSAGILREVKRGQEG